MTNYEFPDLLHHERVQATWAQKNDANRSELMWRVRANHKTCHYIPPTQDIRLRPGWFWYLHHHPVGARGSIFYSKLPNPGFFALSWPGILRTRRAYSIQGCGEVGPVSSSVELGIFENPTCVPRTTWCSAHGVAGPNSMLHIVYAYIGQHGSTFVQGAQAPSRPGWQGQINWEILLGRVWQEMQVC